MCHADLQTLPGMCASHFSAALLFNMIPGIQCGSESTVSTPGFVFTVCQPAASGTEWDESWHGREVDFVHGFPFLSKVFFFRESY